MATYLRGASIAVVVAALVFAVLYGGTATATYTEVDTPLKAALQGISGVTSVKLVRSGADGPLAVRVALAPTADLETVYHALDARMAAAGTKGTIQLIDKTDPTLEAALRNDAFAIEEGIATGGFTAMRSAVLADARSQSVSARVEMDASRIYVTLRDGAHYRFAVYPWKGSG